MCVLTGLNKGAFSDCSGLTSVIWNAENCTRSGYYNPIFSGCSNLKSVTIGDNVKTIPSFAFYDCSGFTSITIPDSVTSIGDYAFSGCSGLTSITIPDSVTSIGKSAFYKSGLTSAIIGKNVTSIGDDAFELKRVYYKGNATQWYRISTGIYNGFGTQYFYSETAPALNRSGLAYDGNYWHYDTDGKTPVIWIKEN